MDGFGGRTMSQCAAPISEMPAAPETVAARAVGLVAVTRRGPGAQAPVRAFTERGALFASAASAEGLKTFAKLVEIAISRTLPKPPRKRPRNGRWAVTISAFPEPP
jgi:hypothetical protein